TREELAMVLVPRQAADDQRSPGPDGLPRPSNATPRSIRAGRTRAGTGDAGRHEARRHPEPQEPAAPSHQPTHLVRPLGAGLRTARAHPGYEASRVTTSIADSRRLSTRFLGDRPDVRGPGGRPRAACRRALSAPRPKSSPGRDRDRLDAG